MKDIIEFLDKTQILYSQSTSLSYKAGYPLSHRHKTTLLHLLSPAGCYEWNYTASNPRPVCFSGFPAQREHCCEKLEVHCGTVPVPTDYALLLKLGSCSSASCRLLIHAQGTRLTLRQHPVQQLHLHPIKASKPPRPVDTATPLRKCKPRMGTGQEKPARFSRKSSHRKKGVGKGRQCSGLEQR